MVTRCGIRQSEFTELFTTEQDCILAAFEIGLERISTTVDEAAGREPGSWLDRLRAGVVGFLGFLDDEPAWGRLLICEPPFADGALALRCSARVLGVLTSLLDDGTPQAIGEFMPEPQLTSELAVGGAVSVIRTRMQNNQAGRLVELAPQLMSFIVRPYLGQAAASGELAGRREPAGPSSSETVELPLRLPHRTTLVLRAIAHSPRSSNRRVAELAGLSDEGQTSKLLGRLRDRGLIENVGLGHAWGEPNEWLLTAYGLHVVARIGRTSRAGAPMYRARQARRST